MSAKAHLLLELDFFRISCEQTTEKEHQRQETARERTTKSKRHIGGGSKKAYQIYIGAPNADEIE